MKSCRIILSSCSREGSFRFEDYFAFKYISGLLGFKEDSRQQASAVNKYVESLIRNAINAGQKLGDDGKPAYGKTQSIEIS
ncbi:MAG: hypothetical protein WBM37_00590 [Nitrososphaeraceae archaeon]